MTERQLRIAELRAELDLLERAETLARSPLKIGDVIRWRVAARKAYRRGRIIDIESQRGDSVFDYYVVRIRPNGMDGGRERVPSYRNPERVEVQG